MNRMSKFILILASACLPLSVNAGLISHTFEDSSDCVGYFGDNFDACQIFVNVDNERIELSPVIAKFGYNDSFERTEVETNDYFSTFDGSEVIVDQSGTWSYNPDVNDPVIRYWSVKAGTSFNLFWYVSDNDEKNYCSGTSTYTYDCLNLAQSVTSGDWSTPGKQALSHFVVYDSEPPKIVPEPTTITLLLIGMAGLVMARRFKPGQPFAS